MRLPKVGEYYWGIHSPNMEPLKGKISSFHQSGDDYFGFIFYEDKLHFNIKCRFYKAPDGILYIGLCLKKPCYTDYPNTSIFKKLYNNGYEHNGFWRVDESI